MEKRMAYSLYKTSYNQFPARDYDKSRKTILVELPDVQRISLPKTWKRSGNSYKAENGARIVVWNSGLAENFIVESGAGYSYKQKTFPAGIDARERVIEYVNSL